MAHCLVALRDIMQDLTRPTPSHPPGLPRIQPMQRRAACTHVTLTRLYGPYQCSHCGKLPRCGWVYRCTQDYGGRLPPWESGSRCSNGAGAKFEQDKQSQRGGKGSGEKCHDGSEEQADVKLKAWMNDAIVKGLYTDEQVAILQVQRQRVIDSIRETEASFHLDQTYARRPLLEAASSSAPNLRSLALGKIKGHSKSMRSRASLKMFPDCNYRTCASCR